METLLLEIVDSLERDCLALRGFINEAEISDGIWGVANSIDLSAQLIHGVKHQLCSKCKLVEVNRSIKFIRK